MPEFTASDPGSSFPNQNILFNSAAGITGQQIQQNQLANQTAQLQLNNAEGEQVGRAAAGLLSAYPDEASRAAAYPRVVGMLQSQGLAKHAPPTYPGEGALRALVSQTVPGQTQAEWLQNIQANQAFSNAGNTASTGAPGTTTGTGVATTPSATIEPAAFNNATAVRDGLIKRGVDPDTATALAANALHESVANPATGRGDNGNSAGLFQWAGPRLQAYTDAYGHSPDGSPLDEQLDNVVRELKGSEAPAAAKIAEAQGPAAKAAAVSQYYLRPKDTQAEMQRRSATALQLQQQIGGGTTTATAAPAGGGGTPGSYQVASTAPVPPPGSTAAPGGSTAAAPAPQATPAGSPAPPQLQPVNANGLTDVQQRQVNALAANPQTTLPQRMATEQAFRNQNIQLQQKQFSDWVQVQQLQTSQGQLSVSQQNSALEYWKAAHPDAKVTMTGGEIITQDPRSGQEIAPRIQVTPQRADTAAMAIVSRLGPKVANGTATPEEQAQYAVAVDSYRQPVLRENPVSKETVRVNTRELPAGFPEPPSLGGGGAPGGAGTAGGANVIMPGLSPAQQQVERDPAAYKVSESQYDRDSKEIAGIADAGRSAQADQIRINEMQDVLQRFSSGPGTEARTAAASFLQRWLPAAVTGWEKQSANLSGAEAAQAFSKLALAGAGSAERSVLGNRGGFQAVKMFQAANPNVDLQDATNKSILDMQLISNQANQDYSQGAQAHFAQNEKSFGGPTHQYTSLAQFDTAWNAQRNPQVYAAAMGAIGGQPASQWTKGLSDDEYARALQIVQRAKPSAVVQTKSGPYSMQPNAVTTGSTAPPGTKVIRFDHNGNVIQ